MAILALSVVALGAVVCAGRLWNQAGANPPGTPAAPAPAAGPPRTRIALINIGHVVRNYEKFKVYEDQIKAAFKGFQDREGGIKKKAEDLAKEAQKVGTTDQRKEAIKTELKGLGRQLEDVQNEFKQSMGKQQEQQLVALYSDVRVIAERFAVEKSYDLVLHYNDAVEEKDYWSGANVARKMQAGALIPLYYPAGTDVSQEIINRLNAVHKANASRPATPAGPAAPARPGG
jgi:Skp family chaperone for outer membrane proteins